MGSDYNRENDPRRNGEGYLDLTAYQAIRNIERATPTQEEDERFHKLLNTIFYLCELADFQIEGRIVLRDKKTWRLWK